MSDSVVMDGPRIFQVPVESDDEVLIELLCSLRPLRAGEMERRFPGLLAACRIACNAIEELMNKRPEKLVHKDGTVQAFLENVGSELFTINPDLTWPVPDWDPQ